MRPGAAAPRVPAALALALALAGAAGSQEPPPPPESPKHDPRYLAKVEEIRRETIEAHVPVVEWCRKVGLLLEVRRLGEEILRADPKQAVRETVAEIAELSVAELSAASQKAGKKWGSGR